MPSGGEAAVANLIAGERALLLLKNNIRQGEANSS